jgi:Integrase core domain
VIAIGFYGAIVTRRLRAMGIRDKPIAPASPWQNGVAERLIGSIRRECLDHIIVFGEAHLRRILISYAAYYNSVRTHRSLHKDAPVSRPVQPAGSIKSHPTLGGLHHHYVRVFGTHSGRGYGVYAISLFCPGPRDEHCEPQVHGELLKLGINIGQG